jgi:hypothetical protein
MRVFSRCQLKIITGLDNGLLTDFASSRTDPSPSSSAGSQMCWQERILAARLVLCGFSLECEHSPGRLTVEYRQDMFGRSARGLPLPASTHDLYSTNRRSPRFFRRIYPISRPSGSKKSGLPL